VNLPLQQMVEAMAPGWNLGNSFDGDPEVTSFGNPAPTQALVQAVRTEGFNTMRIPVTWTDHIGAAPAYAIDPTWMAQVVQTATWAVDAGLYAIVNTHHDADEQWVLFTDPGTTSTTLSAANQAQVTGEVTAVWSQIATAFKSFSGQLIFECFNEPHGNVDPTSGGDAAEQAILNAYLVACVNAIRGTGGNNTTRDIMIQPIGASPVKAGVKALVVPNNDPNILISIHTYFPTGFSLDADPTTWGTVATDYTSMQQSVTQIRGFLPTQAIIIGEWGSETPDVLADRVAHAQAYTQDTTTAGMCPIWWDNGSSYGLINRNTLAWTYPTIVAAMLAGTKTGLATPNVYAQFP
jgi:endoglucanase